LPQLNAVLLRSPSEPDGTPMTETTTGPASPSNARRWPLYAAFLLYLALSSITRVALAAHFVGKDALRPGHLLAILGIGFHMDLAAALLLFLPCAFWLALLPERLYRSRFHRWAVSAAFLVLAGLIVFARVSEWFFFDEFNA